MITFTDNKPYMIVSVNITSQSWTIVPNFRVGDTLQAINKRLHGKARRAGDWLEAAGDGDILRFRISNGKVVEIDYQCYTG